jgi:CO/xanthine dehydrogenase FAD-binding subunit
VPVLFALDARVRLVSTRGEREVSAAEFVRGYRATARAHDELIASVVIPRPVHGERRAFRKVGTRRAQSIAKVVVAVSLRIEADGTVGAARIAAGSVADRTLMLDAFARSIVGRRMPQGDALARVCAEAVDTGCSPRDDVRSTAEYRRFALVRLLERILDELARPAAVPHRS